MSFVTLANLVQILSLMATAVMAISAAIQGVRQGFDPFGTALLAVVTAVGGGTLRDLLIGNTPVFWIRDISYVMTAVPVALVTFLAAKKLPSGDGKRERLLLYFDAVGLALFTLVGVQVGLAAGVHPVSAVMLGCITGIAGGMIRDVLSGLTPSILSRDLYATISLAGGALFVALAPQMGTTLTALLAATIMIAVRSVVIWKSATEST